MLSPTTIEPLIIAVFGTGPHNTYEDWLHCPHSDSYLEEVNSRSRISQNIISNKPPQAIIFIGGQFWLTDNGVFSEAAYIYNKVLSGIILPPNCKVYLAEHGVETTEQIKETIEFLKNNHLLPGRIHVVSTWHQLLCAQVLFWVWGNILVIPHPTPEDFHSIGLMIEKVINGIGGFIYLCILILMNKCNYWLDGGPYLGRIIKERKIRRDSLLNGRY